MFERCVPVVSTSPSVTAFPWPGADTLHVPVPGAALPVPRIAASLRPAHDDDGGVWLFTESTHPYAGECLIMSFSLAILPILHPALTIPPSRTPFLSPPDRTRPDHHPQAVRRPSARPLRHHDHYITCYTPPLPPVLARLPRTRPRPR